MKNLLIISFAIICSIAHSQSIPDKEYHFSVENPIFEEGTGPKVFIDKEHNNRHTKYTGLSAMTEMLESDGFLVEENKLKFTTESLAKMDILVIVNALHDSNVKSWKLPCPSAFEASEIEALVKWVENGGKLFLSADHMPYGGAVQELTNAFGISWGNCFDQSLKKKWPPAVFSRDINMLLSSSVTDSTQFTKQISSIGTFTGSAFQSKKGDPFLVFDNSYELLFPDVAWKFTRKTKRLNAQGWYQGLTMEYGMGKAVFMAESAMFTAQLRRRTKIGMNSSDVPENGQLALNIFRYLATN